MVMVMVVLLLRHSAQALSSQLHVRPFSNLIPLSWIKFLCFHCQYHIWSVYIRWIVYSHLRPSVARCISVFVSCKLLYQWVAFVFHFNFTIFPFYIDFQCKKLSDICGKTTNQTRTIPIAAASWASEVLRVCVCLSIFNMMHSESFPFLYVPVWQCSTSVNRNATNNITQLVLVPRGLLAFAVLHNTISALCKLYSSMNLSPIKYFNNLFNEICYVSIELNAFHTARTLIPCNRRRHFNDDVWNDRWHLVSDRL